ncbi:MAG TPA: hypothetical protein PLU11_09155 [Chitinophagaceae bacterium]|nr:hypothetical protein [Chitinophagaceae bacterium]HPH31130.1 hypothetical protein [Chitinophagaceae bacterium]HPN59329.1 hypothetical protein [Chitinophagaceae bacterium]
MKTFRATMLCVVLTLSAIVSNSQEQKIPLNEPDQNKPRLFSNLPDKIPVTLTNIDNILSAPVGRNSQFRLSEDNTLQFAGEVVSTASKYNNSIQSVVIRSDDFNGARLTISKITNPDGSIRYSGRIISFKHGDLYELENQDGQLVLVKKNYYELVNE